MKRSLAAAAIVAGALLAFRYLQRPLPQAKPPTQPPAPAVPEGLTLAAGPKAAPQELPSTKPPPGPPPSGPRMADLDAILASVDRWKSVPDLRLLNAQCESSPKDKVGDMPKEASAAPTPSRALSRLREEVLCSGILEKCARIETMERPPELSAEQRGWFMTKQSCIRSTVHLLNARAVAEGRIGQYCQDWLLHYYIPAPSQEDAFRLCGMLASDFSTRGRSYCTELRKSYGIDNHEHEHCLEMMHFVDGEQACVDAIGDPPYRELCRSLARTLLAARSGDLSQCKEKVFPGIKPQFAGADPSCLAVMGDPQTCMDPMKEAEKRWVRRRCPAWAVEQMQAWVRDVDANAKFAIDQLPKERRRLDSLSAGKGHHAPRIDAAMISAKEALKSMEAIRDKMNKGQLPGQSASGGGG